MSEYFPKSKSFEGKVKVEQDWSNYATKTKNLKNVTGVDTSDFAKKTDLADLKIWCREIRYWKIEKCTK